MCKGSAGVKLKAVMKTDGFDAWGCWCSGSKPDPRMISVSLVTMIVNPDRAKNFSDMMNKLDRWDALVRDYEMKFDEDNNSDKMR